MSLDDPTNIVGSEPAEYIPTYDEILAEMKRLLEGQEYIELEGRKLSDEKGIFLFEVRTIEDANGDSIDYTYMRKGKYQTNLGEFNNGESGIAKTYYEHGVLYEGGGDWTPFP